MIDVTPIRATPSRAPRPATLARALSVALLLFLCAPGEARAETVRLLVAIGANVGDPEDPPLRYTGLDAERVQRVFVELGELSSDRGYLIVDQPASVVRQKLAEVSGRIAELRAGGKDVLLMIYVSAHARAGVLHLMGTHLPLAELRDFARDSGARLRLLMIDACDSGAIARAKGGRPGPAYEVSLEKLPLHGQVIITSSGPAQPSEEWEALQGSLFTHHLLTGLRGDADNGEDGEVSLAEAYAYAYRRTLASSARTSQRPAFDLDLAGTGELVLTRPVRARSAILFPTESSGQYIVASHPRADVVAEVEKVAGRPLRLAVPAGRYVVRKRKGHSTGVAELELPFGGVRELREDALVWRDFAEVAMKGGVVELRPWSVMLLGGVQSAAVEGTGLRFSGGASLRRTFGPWFARGALSGSGARYRGVDLGIGERSLSLELSAGYRWLAWAVVPHVGLGVEALGIEQDFRRDHEAQIQRVFGQAPLPNTRTLGIAAGPVVGAELPLPGPAFLLVEGQLAARYLPSPTQPAWRAIPRGFVAAGWRF